MHAAGFVPMEGRSQTCQLLPSSQARGCWGRCELHLTATTSAMLLSGALPVTPASTPPLEATQIALGGRRQTAVCRHGMDFPFRRPSGSILQRLQIAVGGQEIQKILPSLYHGQLEAEARGKCPRVGIP